MFSCRLSLRTWKYLSDISSSVFVIQFPHEIGANYSHFKDQTTKAPWNMVLYPPGNNVGWRAQSKISCFLDAPPYTGLSVQGMMRLLLVARSPHHIWAALILGFAVITPSPSTKPLPALRSIEKDGRVISPSLSAQSMKLDRINTLVWPAPTEGERGQCRPWSTCYFSSISSASLRALGCGELNWSRCFHGQHSVGLLCSGQLWSGPKSLNLFIFPPLSQHLSHSLLIEENDSLFFSQKRKSKTM